MENEELFKEIPALNRTFSRLDKDIRYYSNGQWKENTTKERLIKKRSELFTIVKELDLSDLSFLYYLKNIESLKKRRILKKLRAHYQSQCDLCNFLEETDEYIDIFSLGRVEKNKNSQKNP